MKAIRVVLSRSLLALCCALAISFAGCVPRDDGDEQIDLSAPPTTRTINQTIDEGAPNPPDIPITLNNPGNCPAAVTATATTANGIGWLSVSPNMFTIPAGGSKVFLISVNIVGLPGSFLYTGTLGFSATCTNNGKPATGSPTGISFNLFVRAARAILAPTTTAETQDLPTLVDQWSPLGNLDEPEARTQFTAVWTGTEVLIWGGTLNSTGQATDTGARYDPLANTWTEMSTPGAPSPRWSHSAVWTGSRMIVWGGTDSSTNFNDGRSYDPVTNTWELINYPTLALRYAHTAVWTGTEMIVWGGYKSLQGTAASDGARYTPAPIDAWTPMTNAGAPSARLGHTALWTGSRMIVWGGQSGPQKTGAQYDPATDTWQATAVNGAPDARYNHTAVWTGSRMIVFGGSAGGLPFHNARAYDPLTNNWSFQAGIAGGAYDHSAIWTGSNMVVWGGFDGTNNVNSGGIYSGSSYSFTGFTSPTGAPGARSGHRALWTGTQMWVWGGSASGGGLYQ